MSYLDNVRIAVAGTFQADVSTVNNDVRHFDNATFLPAYQQFAQPGGIENGWWNPTGSGAFRLLGCQVTGVGYADGSGTADASADPLVGAMIGGSSDRTSGKIVDIDPQWQLASALFGLDVRLTDRHGAMIFGGRYQPNAFRDLWFSRTVNEQGDRAASATFQSTLDGVTWADGSVAKSRALRELRAATAEGRLSIRLATFGFHDRASDPRFTLGTVVGVIGPYRSGEPSSFVSGRRFVPLSGFSSWAGLTYFTGRIDEASATLLLDLSNALQIGDDQGTAVPIGPLRVGILKDASVQENTPVAPDTFEAVAEIPYQSEGWLQATGGIFAARLTPSQLALARDHPLALVVDTDFNPGATGFGHRIVAIRESQDGLNVCAEPGVHRVDGAGSTTATIYATRFGAPLGGAIIAIGQTGRVPGQGGGSPNNPNPPKAPIPDIGVPGDRIAVPTTVTTSTAGAAQVTIVTRSPGNPRGYVDGQLYLIDYRLPGQNNQARQPFDFIVIHVRDAFAVPSDPTWADIQPIMTQYGNLYPIMSQRLVNLSNPADVKRHAKLLRLAFSLDLEDPNYMPVTRDLSAGKRQTILKWLDKVLGPGDALLDAAAASAALTAAPPPALTVPPGAGAPAPEGGKTQAARSFSRARRLRGPGETRGPGEREP